jgi:hypothetical protein
VSKACESAIETWRDDPSEPTDVNLTLPGGGTTETTTSGDELTAPAEQAGSGVRALDCLSWDTELLYRMCVDGLLQPAN